MKSRGVIISVLVFVFVFSHQTVAIGSDFDMLVVNSEEWVDVYSGVMYANLVGKPFNFVTSREHSVRLPSILGSENIYLIESGKHPFVMGYKSTLEGKGFSVEERISAGGKTLNLDLAGDLDVDKFIVIDDTYGYNAVSLCSYAVVSKSYVLFVDKENIEEVYNFLKDKRSGILIYGYVDEEVTEKLSELNPEIIDYGDKFDNNIEIVKRYRQIRSIDQVTLTSGDFMELGLMRGVEPVLFIGRDSVPEQVADYVKSSGIKVGVLVGNELVSSAQSLKAKTGISVFLKFGQGSGAGAGSAAIRDLDLLRLPSTALNVTIESIAFNIVNNELEIVYKNEVDVFSYIKPSVNIYVDGESIQTVGEREPVLIGANEEYGSTYPLDLSKYDFQASKLTAQVFLQYGESKRSMSRVLEKELEISIVEIRDLADIEIIGLSYDRDKEVLTLKIKNNGPSCHIKPTLALTVKEDRIILGGVDTYHLNEKTSRDVNFELELSDEDLELNENLKVEIVYGERESFMVDKISQDMILKIKGSDDSSSISYPLIILFLLIIIGVLLVGALRKKDKLRGKKNPKKRDSRLG